MRTDTITQTFHADRLVHTAIGWYAMTREAYDLGPFQSRQEANDALVRHIRVHKGLNTRAASDEFCGIGLHDTDFCAKSNCARCAEANILRSSTLRAS